MKHVAILAAVILMVLISPAGSSFAADEKKKEPKWEVIKGQHFLVYYQKDAVFAGKIASSAEEYYNQMASNLGFTKRDNFWLWENRVGIYIFPDRKSFSETENAPEWAAGKASYSGKRVASYEGNESFSDSVLPHEIAHLFFREFIGFKADIPLWLNEGVAQLQEKGKKESGTSHAAKLLAEKKLPSVQDLVATDAAKLSANGNPRDFYAGAVSLVAFMLNKYGADKFSRFCGELRDGRDLNNALRFTYAGSIRTIADLEREWKKHLEEQHEKK